ncbi:uncharacterized protein MYCGRDRAFT_105000 [Zymoseptoria tritici IPO323]|uniref:CinA C-terminal domain-containing protein n=1 Tax=Zymoseptoria tritici (strain CBS 115943 / IPO323) TaxID=336722 RepID=F9XEA7_ZYMTI|nr:uncharacterized protein MYCGRDRAFT_105000 [Zymoseptoria tritici IPO323]EGP86681.1 hypothetical protein MYCGRDRAFT_105000 [Zymoseptoria tritici IPO323]
MNRLSSLRRRPFSASTRLLHPTTRASHSSRTISTTTLQHRKGPPSTTHPSTPPPSRKMSTSTPSFPPSELTSILTEITTLLKSRSETLSIAETAAGGLISSSLLSQPGASKIYAGGLTLYTLPSRVAYAGWTPETIAAYKGPTTDIVAGLAKAVRRDLKSTYTLAESGTAGPTGGSTRNRTPGYVALAVDCERGTFVREVETGLGGDRVANMVRFAEEGLRLLKDVISGEAKL